MATDGQFDPAHFGVYLIDALKDPQVHAAINQSIDHDKLNVNISIEVSKHIKILDDKIKWQGQEIRDLKAQNLELQIRCTELEQYSRKNTLKIEGIQESPDDNPFDTVLDVCHKLKLHPPIELTDIYNFPRVGIAPTDGRPRAMIVKFSSYCARKRVYDTRPPLTDHNKRLRRARSNDVFYHATNSEAAEQPTSLETPAEPSEQHTGRRPGSRAYYPQLSSPNFQAHHWHRTFQWCRHWPLCSPWWWCWQSWNVELKMANLHQWSLMQILQQT